MAWEKCLTNAPHWLRGLMDTCQSWRRRGVGGCCFVRFNVGFLFMLHGVSYLMHVHFYVCLNFNVRLLGGHAERIYINVCFYVESCVFP